MRTLASKDPLMKYLSSTGLNWMQVTVPDRKQIEAKGIISKELKGGARENNCFHCYI